MSEKVRKAVAEPSRCGQIRPSPETLCGFDDHSVPTLSGWYAKKNDPDQAWGHSQGGKTTRIHAATSTKNRQFALHLTEGQAHAVRIR